MKKRFLSILLVLVMLLGALPLTSVTAVAATVVKNDNWYADQTNDGTPNELDIKSPGDFLAFANDMSANDDKFSGMVIHIVNDLDFKSDTGELSKWEDKIGQGKIFGGIIDGHGHTISGLSYFNHKDNNLNGLLGGKIVGNGEVNEQYGANAGVFNLAIVDCEIDVVTDHTGALFGSAESESGIVKFENVYVDISIESSGKYTGGLLGYGASNVVMSNCVFTGEMNITNGGGFIGAYGITKGDTNINLTLEKSAFYGELNIPKGDTCVGAMLGNVGRSSGGRKATVHYKDIIIGDKISEYIKGVVAANCYKDTTLSCENVYSAVSGGWCAGGEGSYPAGKISAVAKDTLVGIKANLPDGFVTLPWGYAMPRGVVNFSRMHSERSETTVASTKYVGFQTTAVDDTYFNIRLSAVTNDGKDGIGLDGISAIGFEIEMRAEIDGTEKIWRNSTDGVCPTVNKVFTSIMGKSDDDRDTNFSANAFGGDYIFVACVTGVRKDLGDVTFIVKTFHDDASGNRVWDDVYVFGFDKQ